MKQDEFGRMLGVHYVTVSRWERGVVRVTLPMARLLRLLVSKAAKQEGDATRRVKNRAKGPNAKRKG